ncbi:Endopolyphosphatase [Friedmanniomyces endolithicus]|uniref:Endopolyphosphatase n=2 Tax=Friedmanniomyces endolithicus TaxID=329885 RepID=A0AAN6QUS5_9PEZI|nr:Endopolyphosphatase [Friedmanniomyces endolithicus]
MVSCNNLYFHPDRFYEVYTSTAEDAACHRGQGPAGMYGAETSECDSPISLVNETMAWIEHNLKDKIDFVIWTGDSARHDNDEDIPRNAAQVIGSNEMMVQKMFEAFGKHNGDENDEDPNNDYTVPIIPSFGNNDILPHNVMAKGPNTWTRTYSRIWRQFIPEAQKHQFEQGGWFNVEVIPNKLAVFSLNTLYFADNNAAVDGCASPSEPGYRQLEWMRIQLQFMRERGAKAILTGHQPPVRQDAKTLWDETCWQKYTLWLRQYRDVIISSHYGHFNYDHFLLQDFEDLEEDTKHGRMEYSLGDGAPLPATEHDDLHTSVSSDYWLELRQTWADLPKPPKSMAWPEAESKVDVTQKKKKSAAKKERRRQKKFLDKIGGTHAERFAASFISASVVPNLFPTIRVFEYNITGLEPTLGHGTADRLSLVQQALPDEESDVVTRKKDKKHKFKIPDPPSTSAPPGPAYSPQTLSLLRYTQYYANITHINNDFSSEIASNVSAQGWNEGKHKGKKPHNKDHEPQPKKFHFKIQYDTRDDDVYQLPDLTMPRLVDLARRIGDFKPVKDDEMAKREGEELLSGDVDPHGKQKKHKQKHGKPGKHTKRNMPWYTFMRRAFVETKPIEEIEEQFGR